MDDSRDRPDGGVAGGKSAVAALLAERGFAVIDADSVGHELSNDPGVQRQLVDRFGTGVLSDHGPGAATEPAASIAKRLGAIVFADPEARRDLEAIVHPLMRAWFVAAIERELGPAHRAALVVLDAAILLEAGWDDLCDLVVFVDAPRAERMRRAAEQRGWSRGGIRGARAGPVALRRKAARADLVITNDAGVDSLRREVDALVRHSPSAGPGASRFLRHSGSNRHRCTVRPAAMPAGCRQRADQAPTPGRSLLVL